MIMRRKDSPQQQALRLQRLTEAAERGECLQKFLDSRHGRELSAEISAQALQAGGEHILGNGKPVDTDQDPVKYAFFIAKVGKFHQGQMSVLNRMNALAKEGAEARRILLKMEEEARKPRRAPGQMTPVQGQPKMGL